MGAEKIEFVTVSVEQLRTLLRAEMKAALEEQRGGDDDLLNMEQAAEAVGCSVTALHKRIQRGHIKPDKLGGKDGFKSHQFTRATIAEYKRSNKR